MTRKITSLIQNIIQLYIKSFSGLSREIWLLTAVMFINRCGTMVIVFLSIYLTSEKGYSVGEAGLVLSCFGAGSLAGSLIGGWLTDRIGYHSVMFWSFVLGGIGFFFLIPLETIPQLSIGVFIVSTINDCFRPANLTAVGIYSTDETRTRSLSLIRLAFNFGMSFGPAVGGLIAVQYGYSKLFMIDGCTCILAGTAFYFLLPKKTPNTVVELKDEKILDTDFVNKPKSKSAYQDVFFLKYVFFIFLNMIVFMHLFTVLQVYQKEVFLLNEFEIGLLLGFNCLLIVIFEMPLVYVLEKKYPVFNIIIIGAFLIGFAFWILPILDFWNGVLILSIVAISFGEIINFPFLNTVALKRAPADRRGEYMGLYGMSFSLALIVAPTMGGYIVDWFSYNTLWFFLGGINLVAMAGFWYLRKLYREENDQSKEMDEPHPKPELESV